MIYELSRDNIDLAREEVVRLAHTTEYKLYGNILVCSGKIEYARLAYTNNVFEEIFISNKIENVDWQAYYKDNFCVRSNITAKEEELAAIIWDAVKEPKVKLKNATTEFKFFFTEDMIICGKKVWTRKEKFHLRRPDIRPGFFPVSLKPKLARVLFNISGVQNGTIWDPFCGTGGILLEAALMDLKVIGTDIDPAMIRAAKKNFDAYKQSGEFHGADAREEIVNCNAIVTDPPYGKRASLKKVEIEQLYREFLAHVYPFVDLVVIMVPNDVKVISKYVQTFETEDYVHGSLTRHILILEKKR